jgi:HAD superfamily hydrolase (TIGR01509 family)
MLAYIANLYDTFIIMYKAVIFDFFDVIHSDPFKSWLKKHRLKPTDYTDVNLKVDKGDISEKDFYRCLSAISGHPTASIEAHFGGPHFVDREVIKVIKALAPGYKIGLLSNSSSEYIRPILQEHDIERLFDEVVISAEVNLVKPSSDIFRLILGKLGIKPEEAVFIDDTKRNVEQASQLGINSIHYTDVARLKQELVRLGL